MKTISIKYIFALLLLAVTLSSCEKEITMDLHPSEPRVVIEGVVQEGEFAKIRLTMSKNYDDETPYTPIEGATVKLSDDKGNTETLLLAPSGAYESINMKGELGASYKLLVEVDGQTYTSETKMPSSITIDTLFIIKFFSETYLAKTIIKDKPGEDNYYRFIVNYNQKEMPTILIDDDDKKDGRLIERTLPFNGDDDELVEMEVNDHLRVEMRCITKEAFDFYKAWDSLLNGGSQVNPPSNIKGGALGFFHAFTTSFIEHTVTAEDLNQ